MTRRRRPPRPLGTPRQGVLATGLLLAVLATLGASYGWVHAEDGASSARAVDALAEPDPTTGPGRPSVAEPSAPRTASPMTPLRPWHVVGIGDSVTSGHGCDCDFVADYAHLTADRTGRDVTADNLGVDGQTSADLRAALAAGGDEVAAVRRADVVLVTIGANDLAGDLSAWQAGDCADASCFRPDVATVRANVEAVVERVRTLRAGAPTRILVTDYWNVFEDGSRAVRDHGRDYLDLARSVTDEDNAAICAGAWAGGATCVDLLGPFRQADGGVDAMLQDDGDHPDGDGHALIARTLLAAGWGDLP